MANDKVIVDLLSGTAGGVAQLCVGHPFDTTKVAMQRSQTPLTPSQAIKQIFTSQGPRGFYRGMGPPLVTVAAFNAVLFGSTGFLNRIIRPDGGILTPAEACLTGSLAGIPASVLATPTELLKCRLQAQGGARPPPGMVYTLADAQASKLLYAGPVDALRSIVKFEGGVQALFRGFLPTLLRETPGNGFYFGAYALIKDWLASYQGLSDASELGPGALMLAGGVAGAAFWAPVLPIDTIKTRIQLDSPFSNRYHGIMDCARQVIRHDGVRGLTRGWQPCLARSVPANAATFVAFEAAKSLLTRA